MVISLNKRIIPEVSSIASRYKGKNIIISIDSSKTNTAICIMSRTYKVLDLLEFDGSQDKDILELIKEQRNAIRIILDGASILDGGIEDIITKKEETSGGRYSEGLKHHHSRYVITAVFVSLISCFQDSFNITLSLIPNQTWKNAILPKDLNRRGIYKGSVEYIRNKYPQYVVGKKSDDGADAICIGEYMKIRNGLDKNSIIEDIPDEKEFIINPCKYRLYDKDTKIKEDIGVQFQYNENLSLELNARAMANRIEKGKLAWAYCRIDQVSIQDIYQFCSGKFNERTEQFKVIVKRTD